MLLTLSDWGTIFEGLMLAVGVYFTYLSWAAGMLKMMTDMARLNHWGLRGKIKTPDELTGLKAPTNFLEGK